MHSNSKKRPKLAIFKNLLMTLIFGVCFVFFTFPVNAAIRDTLSYQAKITDVNLLAPIDANYNMEFRIYDAISGGNLLWTETWNAGNQVALEDGVFTVELNSICLSWTGACASNGGVDWSSDSLFLEMAFDADGNGSFEETFAPRRRFTAVPYAQMAARLNTAEDIVFTNDADHSVYWDQTNDHTLTVENIDATAVANLAVEGQLLVGSFASAPTALGDGAMYYNTSSNLFYVRQNGVWVSVGSGGGGGDAIWDADTDTGIQVEKTADDDTIRFDLGGTTPIADALLINQSNGFVWNDAGDALDFRAEGDTNPDLFFIDASVDNIGIGETSPEFILDLISGMQIGTGSDVDQDLITVDNGDIIANRPSMTYENDIFFSALDGFVFNNPDGSSTMMANSEDSYAYMLANAQDNSYEVEFLASHNSDPTSSTNLYAHAFGLSPTSENPYLAFQQGANSRHYLDVISSGSNITDIIFNDDSYDANFRIEGDNNANLFYIDAGTDQIALGNNSPNAFLDISSDIADALRLNPYGAVAGNTAEMQFMELLANGSNYVGFKAPDNIVSSIAWVLPNADGNNGDFLSTDGSGNLSWASGSVDEIWDVDSDTGIQVEEGSDDDTIRFDLGGTTPIADALLINQTNGFVWNDAGNALDFRLEGDADANLFFLDASADNIGIGEAAPDASAKLEVAGNIMMDEYLYFQNTTTDYLQFDGSDFYLTNDLLPTASATYNLGSSTSRWKKLYLGGNSLHIGDDGNDSDISYDNVNNNLVINDGAESIGLRIEGSTDANLFYLDDANNNIGIGEAAPDTSAKLEVAGNFMLDDYVYFNNTTTDYLRHDGTTFVMSDDLLASVDDSFDFGSSTVRWNDQFMGGTLYLGADGDDYDIHFDETNNLLVLNDAGDADGIRIEGDTIDNLLLIDAANDNIGIALYDTDPAHFDSNLTIQNHIDDHVMRIEGPEGTYHYGAKLRFGDGDYVYLDEYSDDNLMMYAYGNIYLDSGAGQVYMPDAYNNSILGRDLFVAADGQIGYKASSLRYKENVLDMEDISWLYDLRPVNFTYKDKTKEVYNKETGQMETVVVSVDHSKQYGLIAEEAELINPAIVSYDSDGLVETVNYSYLMTPLLKAVQDNKAAVDPILDRVKIANNGLEIERYNAADDTDALVLTNDGEGAGLHLVQTGDSNGLGHGAAIYISGDKNSSAGDNDGIADSSDSYGIYINSEESNGEQKIIGMETDAGQGNNTENFYVRADGVTKVYAAATAPVRNEDGEFGFAMAGSRGRLYFQAGGTDFYINRSGTGDFSEYVESSDPTLFEDWGTIISLQVGGVEAKAKRSSEMRDKNVLGVVSEFGTRNNDNEEGSRHEDPNYVNVALMGQVPAKVTVQNGVIEAGDYLTTSLVYGHAMKADVGDPVIGIALESFYGGESSDEGMIDILLSRNTNGNISALLQELQEKKSLSKEEVLDVIMNENLVSNYLVMTKGEVMDGLKVHGELELDKQNIGEVIMPSGETHLTVIFPYSFKKKPVVTVTPHLVEDNEIFFNFQYLLTNISTQGFVIKLNQPLSYDLYFNWQAFAVADYTDDFIVSERTTIAEEKPVINSLNCSLDNLGGCLTAHDCWQYSDVATWTGEACVLKENSF